MSNYAWPSWRYKPRSPLVQSLQQGVVAPPVGGSVGGNPYGGSSAPTPPAPGQDVSQQVFGIVNPQLQAAADAINRRSTGSAQAISSLTGVYGQRMAAASGQDVFGPENPMLQGAADWGQSSLTGAGKADAASLGADIAQAGPGIKGPRDVNLAQQGQGAGGAAYGTGISWLDAQVAKAAAAQTRAALEPGFAAGMGQMYQGIVTSQLARQLADQQGQIEAQIPQLTLDLTQRQQDVTYRNAQAAEAKREYEQGRADTLAQNRAKIVGPQAPTTGGRLAYYQGLAQERTKHDPNGYVWEGTTTGIHPVKDAKTGKPIVDPAFSAAVAAGQIPKAVKVGNTVGHYDSTGTFVPDYTAPFKPTAPPNLAFKNVMGGDGKVHTIGVDPKTGKQRVDLGLAGTGAKAGTTVKLPTAAQVNTLVDRWYTGKPSTKLVKQPNLDAQQNPVYRKVPAGATGQLSYQQGYGQLRAMGYDDQRARGLLDTRYTRGTRARPWLDPTERAALKAAGLQPKVTYYKNDPKNAFLTPAQVAALQKAKRLPLGEWRGKRYYVRPGYN